MRLRAPRSARPFRGAGAVLVARAAGDAPRKGAAAAANLWCRLGPHNAFAATVDCE